MLRGNLSIFLCCFFLHVATAQQNNTSQKKDTLITQKSVLLLQPSFLITGKSFGLQAGLSKNILIKEKRKFKKNGKEKIKFRPRIFAVDFGYYYQPGLHHNWMLTGNYTFRSISKKGVFADFSPILGVSRTFISDETYKVDDVGNVSLKKAAGNWYVVTGFGVGGGKQFSEKKYHIFKEVNAKLLVQFFYPNFGFVSLRPSLQIGTSVQLKKHSYAFKKLIKYK